jgi:tetratricopeptide (TPR) repeat protein
VRADHANINPWRRKFARRVHPALWLCAAAGILVAFGAPADVLNPGDLFQRGTQAYVAGKYDDAAKMFQDAAAAAPSVGTLQNLGNAEWERGWTGPAMLAWERAAWLDPHDANARSNLRFARKAAQLDAPDLAWYEVCSTWLPVNDWAWLAAGSFWLAVAMLLAPPALRWRRADWYQGAAAAGFAIFLLTLPALGGVHTRSKIGIVLSSETPLRLTPTADAQVLTRAPAGETARLERERGGYVYIRTAGAAGWVERGQFGLVSGGSGS